MDDAPSAGLNTFCKSGSITSSAHESGDTVGADTMGGRQGQIMSSMYRGLIMSSICGSGKGVDEVMGGMITPGKGKSMGPKGLEPESPAVSTA